VQEITGRKVLTYTAGSPSTAPGVRNLSARA
jgi:hypothetical protein